jgi:hypothetical protein
MSVLENLSEKSETSLSRKQKLPRLSLLAAVLAVTFSVFFADGYLQWINSDTAGEAYSLTQDIRFPQGLLSENPHQPRTADHVISYYHSRITGHILSYASFNIVGPIYRELFDAPVDSLYVAQGFMSGSIFVFLILISAAYVSCAAPVLSMRYLGSAALLTLFTMALPPVAWLNSPFGMTVRFSHLAVTSNYVGTIIFALCVFFPYWRYLCTGKWSDFYENASLRIPFYTLLIAAVFSSTATTLWMMIMAAGCCCFLLRHFFREGGGGAGKRLQGFLRDSRSRPLLLIIALGFVAIGAEVFTYHGHTSLAEFSLRSYLGALTGFFTSSADTKHVVSLFAFCLGIYLYHAMKDKSSARLRTLHRALPWLLILNLLYIIVVGMPNREYRFGGYNFGRDTIFPATWTLSLWLFSVLIGYWREKRLYWLAPLLLYILMTNALGFFTFPLAGVHQYQKKVFERVRTLDGTLPPGTPITIPAEGIAFNRGDCEIFTVPMLRRAGIVSPQRKVNVVP